MVITLLILLLGPVLYCYLGYPVVLRLLARFRAKPWRRDDSLQPTISVILAAYNEERGLEECLNSVLRQDYPASQFEILIGSDASTDGTNEILTRLAASNPNVKPFLFRSRRGKLPILNDLVKKATGETLVFIDADVTLDSDLFQAHVRNYADPEVACVTGRWILDGNNDQILGRERQYLSLEDQLRKNEALVLSTVGNFGCNFSMRRNAFEPVPDAPIHDDMFAVLQVIRQGKRVVFEDKAITRESVFVRTIKDEFKRKSRNAGRGFRTLAMFPDLLSPRAGVMALMVWSHRVLRWSAPLFLIAAAFVSLATQLVSGANVPAVDYTILFILLCMGLGFFLDRLSLNVPVISHLYWFGVMNLAFANGAFRFLFGKEPLLWSQTTRGDVPVTEQEAVQL